MGLSVVAAVSYPKRTGLYSGPAQYAWATKPAASASDGETIRISDIGVGGSLWISDGANWQLLGGHALLASGVGTTVTGAAGDTAIATLSGLIKGGMVGSNGRLVFRALFSYTNSANNKVIKLNLSGTTIYSSTPTTTAVWNFEFNLIANNSETAQKASPSTANVYGTLGGSVQTLAVDLTADKDVIIYGAPAGAAETISLVGYDVILLR